MRLGGRLWWRSQGWLVAGCLLVLTLAAVLIPPQLPHGGDDTLLALLPEPDPRRQEALIALTAFLNQKIGLNLRVQTVTDKTAFAAAAPAALLTFSPDAVALNLPLSQWQALAAGRRRVPWHQRPAAVLVSRRDAADSVLAPWRTQPARTVFGDSLSLVCLAPLCAEDTSGALPAGVGWGSDPYDHSAVLAAVIHGAYDHAVVRQWDAEAAQLFGTLDPARWQIRRLSDALPDLVVMVARRAPAALRLELQEALTMLGRADAEQDPNNRLVRAHLGQFGLDGFNLLLGPDCDRLRRLYGRCWLGSGR
ncbi:MAG: hypothetical protein PHQ53_12210 [Candidatus Krumholzibacteria bacterium]|nr:hypothetical protein [Candidatus Krumholzibacteria bacterium]